ncbi:MAG: acyl-CoA thioesterase [Alphaproteobacteria bacterium]|nr:acyl-CoA thioesterase [Alphaproteobacteria bacterium]
MEPIIKIIAMPKDGNADGDVFGGWILSMMDLAGGTYAKKVARNRVVTVAVDKMVFHKPVFIGDCLECFAETVKIGSTSLTVKVDAYVERKSGGDKEKVTEGVFVFVAIDQDRRPVKLSI